MGEDRISDRTAAAEVPAGEADLEQVESRLGHRFADRTLLLRALTHRSYANEQGEGVEDNEVLEFLGDAALGLIASDLLCRRMPHLSEGQMSKLKSILVSADTLGNFARRLGLGRFVRLGRGEEKTDGRNKNSILANTVEAIIGALYLDAGLEQARTFSLGMLEPVLRQGVAAGGRPVRDFKSALQERLQSRGLALPEYEVIEEAGPDHDKTFSVQVRVGGVFAGRGSGRTKKRAEQAAARQALERLEELSVPPPSEPPEDSG